MFALHDVEGEALEEVWLEPPVDVLLAEVAVRSRLLAGDHQLLHVIAKILDSAPWEQRGDEAAAGELVAHGRPLT